MSSIIPRGMIDNAEARGLWKNPIEWLRAKPRTCKELLDRWPGPSIWIVNAMCTQRDKRSSRTVFSLALAGYRKETTFAEMVYSEIIRESEGSSCALNPNWLGYLQSMYAAMQRYRDSMEEELVMLLERIASRSNEPHHSQIVH